MTSSTSHRVQQPIRRPEVGDILAASWGYEQTNVDYFQVIRLTAARVVVRPIAARRDSADSGWTGHAQPIPDAFTGPELRRAARHHQVDRYCIAVNTVTNAYLWHGQPTRYTTYA